MSQQNVDIVRRCYRVWAQRDWSQVPELADPDVTIDLSRNVFNPDVYHGVAGFYRLVSVMNDVWDHVDQVPTEFVDAGDNVVAAVTLRGKGRESGIEVEMHLFAIWTLREGRVVRLVGGYRDRAEALAAAGLSENVEIIRAVIDAFNRGDLDAAMEHLAPHFELDLSRALGPYRGVYRLDQARRFLEDFTATFASTRLESDECIDAGEHVVLQATFHLRGRDGIEARARATQLWTIRDGTIVRFCLYQEKQEALEAVGLSTQDGDVSPERKRRADSEYRGDLR
jgi:ketosteroid isomerase-like protein